jgi:hypothetical protein
MRCPRRERKRNTSCYGVRAELKVHGQTVILADPSGGIFNAAGDFDRLLPVTGEAFPILARIGPFSDVVIAAADLASLASEGHSCSGRRMKARSGAACSGSARWPWQGRASQAPNSGSSGTDCHWRPMKAAIQMRQMWASPRGRSTQLRQASPRGRGCRVSAAAARRSAAENERFSSWPARYVAGCHGQGAAVDREPAVRMNPGCWAP